MTEAAKAEEVKEEDKEKVALSEPPSQEATVNDKAAAAPTLLTQDTFI